MRRMHLLQIVCHLCLKLKKLSYSPTLSLFVELQTDINWYYKNS